MGMQTLYGVIFDLEGTLAYVAGEETALRRAGARDAVAFLRSHGMDLPAAEFVEKYVEALAFAARKSALEQEEHLATDTLVFLLQFYGYPKADPQVVRRAVDLTFAPVVDAYRLYEDAREVLLHLRERGMRLGILANAQDEPAARRAVVRLGLDALVDLVVISAGTEARHRKPATAAWDPFWQAWDVLPYETVMVGDDLVEDMLGALNANVWTIWVRRQSAGSELERAIRPDAVVSRLAEVPEIIARWEEG